MTSQKIVMIAIDSSYLFCFVSLFVNILSLSKKQSANFAGLKEKNVSLQHKAVESSDIFGITVDSKHIFYLIL